MRNVIRALDEIRTCCEEERDIPSELRPWLSEALGRFLDQHCDDLDDAFGLRQGRGGVPWWLERGIAERDAALRELAQVHFAQESISRQARKIADMSARYEVTRWRRDAVNTHMPEEYAGTPRQYLFAAFRSGARMPLSGRHLRSVLRTSAIESGVGQGDDACLA